MDDFYIVNCPHCKTQRAVFSEDDPSRLRCFSCNFEWSTSEQTFKGSKRKETAAVSKQIDSKGAPPRASDLICVKCNAHVSDKKQHQVELGPDHEVRKSMNPAAGLLAGSFVGLLPFGIGGLIISVVGTVFGAIIESPNVGKYAVCASLVPHLLAVILGMVSLFLGCKYSMQAQPLRGLGIGSCTFGFAMIATVVIGLIHAWPGIEKLWNAQPPG